MGESSMDAPISDSPMGDSEETDLTALQVSVSFGRFQNDLLAWEKWSAFPSNKYLEEVEKCSTPGSVAQKKAYFEAHYRKIAARKAEQEEQDKADGVDLEARGPVDSQAQAQRDLMYKFCEAEQVLDAEKISHQIPATGIELENEVASSAGDPADSEVQPQSDLVPKFVEAEQALDAEKRKDQCTVNGVEMENERPDSESETSSNLVDEPKDSNATANETNDSMPVIERDDKSVEAEQVLDAEKRNDQCTVNGVEIENEMPDSESEMSSDHVDEPKVSNAMANETNGSMPVIERDKDKSSRALVSPELHISEEIARVKDEASSLGSERVEELTKQIDNARYKEEKVKPENFLKSQKATTAKKATSATVLKKKAAASIPKSSLLSTPKFSRPTLSKSTMSESRASSKKEHGTSPLISRKPARAESKKAAPTSLHMSLSLGPDSHAKTEPAPTTTMRRSLFMEKMGDKEIVKRAFRAFRNDFNHLSSSSPGKPTLVDQIPGKDTGIKASVVGTPQKKIEGVSNLVKRNPQSSQAAGQRKTLNSTRSPHTSIGGNQRTVKSVSSTYGVRSRDNPDKRKEKLEEKANAKAAERTQIQSKVKKGAEIKRLSPDHYTKSKPILGTAILKSSLDKKSAK